jgi:hypothetical protein
MNTPNATGKKKPWDTQSVLKCADTVPGNKEILAIFDVPYLHVRLPDDDELYFTEYGLPFIRHLLPGSFWTDPEWFDKHSTKLFSHDKRQAGTSAIYKVRTREVDGRGKDIVLKWNRMGQDIPGEGDCEEVLTAEFNSPYEEFSLVMEMRDSWRASSGKPIRTHKPLAIYVPAERVELWQSGRREYKMRAKMRSHGDIEIDMFRSYAVIYEWIKGIDVAEAHHKGVVTEEEMKQLTLRVEEEMKQYGFVVRDRKPQHIIVRPDSHGSLRKNRQGEVLRAVVDFELLERTPERDELVKKAKRGDYLRKQARRFDSQQGVSGPLHLKEVHVLGVDYIYGHAESTGGALWVVGRDPSLFDYFLPERWRGCPRTRLSHTNPTYRTLSKDNINLVWKVSRVGEAPDMDPSKEEETAIQEYGYNSPFEEVALAIELSRSGVPAVYPRTIYMTGHESGLVRPMRDESRYESHKAILTPEGTPVLRRDRDYIIIWGFWNKPDEMLAQQDGEYYKATDALHALRSGLLSKEQYLDLVQKTRDRLAAVGVTDLNLRGNHLLLSAMESGQFVRNEDGSLNVHICNFELLKKTRKQGL